ncbi:MAG: alpha/beta hydrolase [Candidatus Moraniibacteriota bacterium]|nr:MAG: alpha/beta hydrolase [Candidatus Moranbacteria bacterium]
MFLRNFFENPSAGEKKAIAKSSEDPTKPELQDSRKEEWAIETAGGKTKVYEFIPKDPISEVPVFLAPGFGGTEAIYEKSILEFVQENRRRVLTVDHPRFGGRRIENDKNRFASTELSRRSLNISEVLEELERRGTPRVDAITHSEGTINLIEAAAENPERFRNIILFAPAGFINKTDRENFIRSITSLARNFVSDLFKSHGSESEEERQRRKTALQKGVVYVLQNIFRSMEEIVGIATTDLCENLEKIRNTSNLKNLNTKILVAAPINDAVFPFEDMKEILQTLYETKKIDGIVTVTKGHSALYQNGHFSCIGKLFDTLEGRN